MITIFNRKELATISDIEHLSKIRQTLAGSNIDYKISFFTPLPGNGRYNSGTFGGKRPCYIIYVKRKDYDEAMFVIRSIR